MGIGRWGQLRCQEMTDTREPHESRLAHGLPPATCLAVDVS